MHLTVIGATGFVGRLLVARLAAEGHTVTAVARRPPEPPVTGATQEVPLDVADEAAVASLLAGSDGAYYLVHSMSGDDFRAHDLELASGFGRAAAAAGVPRIVYVGALGDDPGSEHLRSRQEVGTALGSAGVPVVELRAAVVIGTGSISFEMLRYLTERLPFMVCPRWVHTRIQPIAARDLVEHLVRALVVEPGIYEVGGAEVTTYREMIATYARVRGLTPRAIVDVPYLTPRLSSYWVDLVTPVDRHVSHALIDSLVTEVVVHDRARTEAAFGLTPMRIADAIREALDDQERALEQDLFDAHTGLRDGVYRERIEAPLAPPHAASAAAAVADLGRVGGDHGWYGVAGLWRARVWGGRLFGERLRLRRAPGDTPVAGDRVDWWTVVRSTDDELVLRGQDWFAGESLLGYRVEPDAVVLVGALRPRGVPGFLYWKLLTPVHHHVFRAMARRRAHPTARLEADRARAATMPFLR